MFEQMSHMFLTTILQCLKEVYGQKLLCQIELASRVRDLTTVLTSYSLAHQKHRCTDFPNNCLQALSCKNVAAQPLYVPASNHVAPPIRTSSSIVLNECISMKTETFLTLLAEAEQKGMPQYARLARHVGHISCKKTARELLQLLSGVSKQRMESNETPNNFRTGFLFAIQELLAGTLCEKEGIEEQATEETVGLRQINILRTMESLSGQTPDGSAPLFAIRSQCHLQQEPLDNGMRALQNLGYIELCNTVEIQYRLTPDGYRFLLSHPAAPTGSK